MARFTSLIPLCIFLLSPFLAAETTEHYTVEMDSCQAEGMSISGDIRIHLRRETGIRNGQDYEFWSAWWEIQGKPTAVLENLSPIIRDILGDEYHIPLNDDWVSNLRIYDLSFRVISENGETMCSIDPGVMKNPYTGDSPFTDLEVLVQEEYRSYNLPGLLSGDEEPAGIGNNAVIERIEIDASGLMSTLYVYYVSEIVGDADIPGLNEWERKSIVFDHLDEWRDNPIRIKQKADIEESYLRHRIDINKTALSWLGSTEPGLSGTDSLTFLRHLYLDHKVNAYSFAPEKIGILEFRDYGVVSRILTDNLSSQDFEPKDYADWEIYRTAISADLTTVMGTAGNCGIHRMFRINEDSVETGCDIVHDFEGWHVSELSGDGNRLFCRNADEDSGIQQIEVWNCVNGNLQRTIETPPEVKTWIWSMELVQLDRYLICSGLFGLVALNIDTGELVAQPVVYETPMEGRYIRILGACEESNLLLTLNTEPHRPDRFRLWDSRNGKLICESIMEWDFLESEQEELRWTVIPAPDCRSVWGLYDGQIVSWDVLSGSMGITPHPGGSPVSLQISPNGDSVISYSKNPHGGNGVFTLWQ